MAQNGGIRARGTKWNLGDPGSEARIHLEHHASAGVLTGKITTVQEPENQKQTREDISLFWLQDRPPLNNSAGAM